MPMLFVIGLVRWVGDENATEDEVERAIVAAGR